MAHETEAACLIHSGAAYGHRIGLRSAAGATVFAGFKPGAFSLYFDDEPYYHLDLEGRWQRALVDGVHYLKGLDTSVVAIERIREGENLVLRRRALSFAEANDLDDRVRSAALDLIEAAQSGRWSAIEPPPKARPLATGDLLDILETIGGWDAAAWFRHRERYLSTYGPLPLLPPEAQQAVVLQAALGHASGIAFGGGPPAEPYTRDRDEFRAHALEVAALYGRRIAQCRLVFLAGADLLHLPGDEIAARLSILHEVFPIGLEGAPLRLAEREESGHRLAGVIAFLDDFGATLPDRAAWGRFASSNLMRVVLGVESGDRDIRALYGKTWDDDALPPLVADLKAAGIAVSILVLAGAGGAESADRHRDATVDRIGGLELGLGDFVYVLDADEVGGNAGRDRLIASGRTPLGPHEIGARKADLKAGLADRLAAKRARALAYSLEKQWS